jgi:hypothetical protein
MWACLFGFPNMHLTKSMINRTHGDILNRNKLESWVLWTGFVSTNYEESSACFREQNETRIIPMVFLSALLATIRKPYSRPGMEPGLVTAKSCTSQSPKNGTTMWACLKHKRELADGLVDRIGLYIPKLP